MCECCHHQCSFAEMTQYCADVRKAKRFDPNYGGSVREKRLVFSAAAADERSVDDMERLIQLS